MLLGTVGSGATSVTVTGLTPGATETFAIEAYNASSTASTAWVSVVMPASPTLTAPVVTATATSSTTGKLSWTASSGATGYDIYYLNGGRAVSLGSVGSATTSVAISGMAPGTTYEFEVVAYNRTSQAASQWTALTTPASAAKAADLTFTGVPDLTIAVAADPSTGFLVTGAVFNQAVSSPVLTGGSATSNSASAQAVATLTLGSGANQTIVGAAGTGAGGGFAPGAANSSNGGMSLGSSLTMGTTVARQDGGPSVSWDGLAPTLAAHDFVSDAHDVSLIRQSSIESLDTLFGQEIEWARMRSQQVDDAAGAEAEAVAVDAGQVQRPSAAVLAVGLAISALWSASDRVNHRVEPRQSFLKRRQTAP